MKRLLNSKYLLPIFLFTLCLVNIIQSHSTELLADEAYYWAYSNHLDWGYFDHPPMVAVWISISKIFFSTGELSVRFFSAVTLSITFYFIWLLIDHPKKKEFTWLFILLLITTSLFNVYGFITVPDAPLLFFIALFLVGYQKYLNKKSVLSYGILAISMAGMLYSKYQGVLVIFFVLLSNVKVLKDWKIWMTTLVTIVLFSPHLYWQFSHDFPSIKYHLVERSSSRYRIDFTTNHFLNLIAIIGFTFPIVYKAFFKRFKVKDQFEKALRFIVIGFAVFFLISSFKNHVQAQWIVPISIPLIIIPFYYLVENQNNLKLFKILASVTIIAATFLRFAMANDDLLPKQFEMHGNKKWVQAVDKELKDKTPLFLNSYQNASLYWFYSEKRPYQLNSWNSRKNQYDLYDYNKSFTIDNPVLVGVHKEDNPTDSIYMKNNGKIYLKQLSKSYKKIDSENIFFRLLDTDIRKNSRNILKVKNLSKQNKAIDNLKLFIVLRSDFQVQLHDTRLIGNSISFYVPTIEKGFSPNRMQLIGTLNNEAPSIRLSEIKSFNFIDK